MLDKVELGLGGVAAQNAVVEAALALHAALVLLQVLRGGERGTCPGQPRREPAESPPARPTTPFRSDLVFPGGPSPKSLMRTGSKVTLVSASPRGVRVLKMPMDPTLPA